MAAPGQLIHTVPATRDPEKEGWMVHRGQIGATTAAGNDLGTIHYLRRSLVCSRDARARHRFTKAERLRYTTLREGLVLLSRVSLTRPR